MSNVRDQCDITDIGTFPWQDLSLLAAFSPLGSFPAMYLRLWGVSLINIYIFGPSFLLMFHAVVFMFRFTYNGDNGEVILLFDCYRCFGYEANNE